jgi:hypothetical protein
MTYRHISLNSTGLGKLDMGTKDWRQSSGSINEDDANAMNAFITPEAMRKVLMLFETLKYLTLMLEQRLQYTPIFYYDEATGCFTRINDKVKRVKYAPYFEAIKFCINHNNSVQKEHISGKAPFNTSSYHNLSTVFIKYKEGIMPGYISFMTHKHPERLGEETIFIFYHKKLKTCCLAISPTDSELIRHKISGFLNTNSIVLPLRNICASCGLCAVDLKECDDCKVTRYCNRDCQKTHWSGAHKNICRMRKAKLDQQKDKLKMLALNSTRKYMSVWISRHSFPVRLGPLAEALQIDSAAVPSESLPDSDSPEIEYVVSDYASGLPLSGETKSMVAMEGERSSYPSVQHAGSPDDGIDSDVGSVKSVD